MEEALVEEEVHICEPEQGSILSEEDEEKRLSKSLESFDESSSQHVEMLIEEEQLNEAGGPHDYGDSCGDASHVNEDVGEDIVKDY